MLNKKYLLALIAYALDQDTSHYNRFDLIKTIPTVACIQVRFKFKYFNNKYISIISIRINYEIQNLSTLLLILLIFSIFIIGKHIISNKFN